ncbi:Uncharacterised protein [Salmonella enterica subsp. enterica serovar Bovismorbificans]|uniref:Uncharacterized protein n=1 Tax=Salmonella enterica subsp. enterica serovar Bovismorbificans TaxID=58097 RepID=A0A655DZN2_SALET|nr:Uncharacterised protein [Salmonella enterica subsp. enterica serovar Bovismorbificans]CNU93939.1 Uncharacterised protein [Salmonella enterica subsp. enterica serovar Bovismorbificans]
MAVITILRQRAIKFRFAFGAFRQLAFSAFIKHSYQ